MKKNTDNNKQKRSTAQWIGMGLILGFLYLTGLHTSVIAGMQRAMLYTGLFNAKAGEITDMAGPFLQAEDFSFTMHAPDKSSESFREYEGKVTFINVWASWCPPCLAEMPTIRTLYESVADHEDIRFILLSVDQDREAAIRFMENNHYKMPYFFPATRIPSLIQSSVLPTSYVISAEGQVVYKKEGIADYSSPAFREWLLELQNAGTESSDVTPKSFGLN